MDNENTNPAATADGFTAAELAELESGTDQVQQPEEKATPAPVSDDGQPQQATDQGQQQDKANTKPPQGYVPQQALHESRAKEKAARERAEKLEQMWTRALEAQTKPQAQQQPGDTIPAYEDDPIGNLTARLAKAEGFVQETQAEKAQRAEREQQQNKTNEMLNRYAATVHEYQKEAPDFNDAYKFLTATVDAELIARGIDDPVERTNIMQYEEGVMVARAMHSGKNPAEVVYNYAKHRGFKGPPAQPQQPAETPLDKLAKGAQAARSLTGKGTQTDEGDLSLEALTKLFDTDPAAADKAFEKLARSGRLG